MMTSMTSKELNDIEDLLPPKPRAPNPRDCCGSGCCPCVHDIYEEDLKTWKKECKRIQRKGQDEEAQCGTDHAIQPDKWKEFEIIHISEVNTQTYLYTFKLQDYQCLGVDIGQHIIVKQNVNGKPVTRQYTPITDIHQRGSFQVLIKIYPTGKVTPVIKGWQVGDLVPWRGPFGKFKYKSNHFKQIVMLAAGTGIAPLYQLIKSVVENEEDETFIKLFYASKFFSDILLREELASFCQFWNFTMCHYLSNEEDTNKKRYREKVVCRRISKSDVREELTKGPIDSTLVLICGTKSFDKDMVNAAKDVKVPDKNIFKF